MVHFQSQPQISESSPVLDVDTFTHFFLKSRAKSGRLQKTKEEKSYQCPIKSLDSFLRQIFLIYLGEKYSLING